jgi:hypothetical protein
MPNGVELSPEGLNNRRLFGLQLALALHDDHVRALEADQNNAISIHKVDGLVIVGRKHFSRLWNNNSPATAGQIDDHVKLSECRGELHWRSAARRGVMSSLHPLCQVGTEREAAIELHADDVVALASGFLKPIPVQHRDLAAPVGYVA